MTGLRRVIGSVTFRSGRLTGQKLMPDFVCVLEGTLCAVKELLA